MSVLPLLSFYEWYYLSYQSKHILVSLLSQLCYSAAILTKFGILIIPKKPEIIKCLSMIADKDRKWLKFIRSIPICLKYLLYIDKMVQSTNYEI